MELFLLLGKSNSNSTSHLGSPLSFHLNGLLLVSTIIVKDLSAIPIQRRAITPLSRLPVMGYRLSKLNRFLKSQPLGLGNLSALIVHDCSCNETTVSGLARASQEQLIMPLWSPPSGQVSHHLICISFRTHSLEAPSVIGCAPTLSETCGFGVSLDADLSTSVHQSVPCQISGFACDHSG